MSKLDYRWVGKVYMLEYHVVSITVGIGLSWGMCWIVKLGELKSCQSHSESEIFDKKTGVVTAGIRINVVLKVTIHFDRKCQLCEIISDKHLVFLSLCPPH